MTTSDIVYGIVDKRDGRIVRGPYGTRAPATARARRISRRYPSSAHNYEVVELSFNVLSQTSVSQWKTVKQLRKEEK